MQAAAMTGGKFTHVQQPSAIPAKRKFRDPNETAKNGSGNIMWDKRIVRGNTYSAQVLPLSAQTELALAEKETKKQQQKLKAEKRRQDKESKQRSTTPEPIDGRKHIEIQTEQYLEELTDKLEEYTVDTQTDPMMDRPPSPLFIPAKSGRDMETQIEEGDLFDFEFEVDPILEVMVGKTIEQAMLEVMQEEEIEALRQQQLKYEQLRKEEEMEAQRLEAQERRRYEEVERRKKQEIERLKKEKIVREKLASRMFAQQYLTNLEHHVFAQLEDEGWFHDSVEREVELEFMPWLLGSVEQKLQKKRRVTTLVEDLIQEALQALAK